MYDRQQISDEHYYEVGIVLPNSVCENYKQHPWRWKEDDIIHIPQENSIISEMECDWGKGND